MADILQASPTGARGPATLPQALHDASASTLGAAVNLFGGGVVSSFSQITRIDGAGATEPDRPAAHSGLRRGHRRDRQHRLHRWRLHQRHAPAHDPGVASRHRRLGGCDPPQPLRYAAVAAAGGKLTIAGGTSGEETSRDIYRFDPVSGSLARIGLLPHPLTHAAAAAFGGTVYVFGGREASPTSQTDRILAIEAGGKVRPAGLMPTALSDLAAVALGESVVLAGGRDGAGVTQRAILRRSPPESRRSAAFYGERRPICPGPSVPP